MNHFSRITDKGPSIAERVIKTIRNLLKKPIFEKGNADCLSELPAVLQNYKKTIHNSLKITPIQASKKVNEKIVYNNLKDNREVQKTKFKLGQLVRTTDIEKQTFSLRLIAQTIAMYLYNNCYFILSKWLLTQEI